MLKIKRFVENGEENVRDSRNCWEWKKILKTVENVDNGEENVKDSRNYWEWRKNVALREMLNGNVGLDINCWECKKCWR